MIKQLSIATKALVEIVKNPKILNRITDDNTVWAAYVAKKHPQFKSGLPVAEITDLITGFNEVLNTACFLGSGSTPLDLCLIKSMCKSFTDASYFEIGTWMGESTANAAEVSKECVTLNIDPDLYVNGKYKSVMGFFSKNVNNIKQIYGDSRTFDYVGLGKKFDVIFIDGDHHHPAIASDSAKVFQHLVHDKSVVIWHDYGRDPATPRFETLAGILDGVPANLHKNLYHVSNTLCAIYTTKPLKATRLEEVVVPNKKFRVVVEAKPL